MFTKVCKDCTQPLPHTSFYKRNATKFIKFKTKLIALSPTSPTYSQELSLINESDDGLDIYCKKCRCIRQKQCRYNTQYLNARKFWLFHQNRYTILQEIIPNFSTYTLRKIISPYSAHSYQLYPSNYLFFSQISKSNWAVYTNALLDLVLTPNPVLMSFFQNPQIFSNSHSNQDSPPLTPKQITLIRNSIDLSIQTISQTLNTYAHLIPLLTFYKQCKNCRKFQQTYPITAFTIEEYSVMLKKRYPTHPSFLSKNTLFNYSKFSKDHWSPLCVLCQTPKNTSPYPTPIDTTVPSNPLDIFEG